MTKYILVGGYVNKAEDGGKAFCEELVKDIDNKPIKILDCTFARPLESWQETIEKDRIFFSKFIKDFELELALPEKFTEQVKNSDVVFLRGGFAQQLMDALSKDKTWMKELDGKILAGTSAGAKVLSKYYYLLGTGKPENGLCVLEGFNLVPIKFIPHWQSKFFDDIEQDIDWEKAFNELKNYKEDLPIYNLAEGEFKVFKF